MSLRSLLPGRACASRLTKCREEEEEKKSFSTCLWRHRRWVIKDREGRGAEEKNKSSGAFFSPFSFSSSDSDTQMWCVYIDHWTIKLAYLVIAQVDKLKTTCASRCLQRSGPLLGVSSLCNGFVRTTRAYVCVRCRSDESLLFSFSRIASGAHRHLSFDLIGH